MGLFQQRSIIRSLLHYLWDRRADFNFLFNRVTKETDLSGQAFCYPFFVFFSIVLIATAVELIGSYIMEFTTGSWLWDYRRFAFHFQGRIALNPSLRFGIGGMLFLYLLQPLFLKLTSHLSEKKLSVITGILAGLFFLDVLVWLLKIA